MLLILEVVEVEVIFVTNTDNDELDDEVLIEMLHIIDDEVDDDNIVAQVFIVDFDDVSEYSYLDTQHLVDTI